MSDWDIEICEADINKPYQVIADIKAQQSYSYIPADDPDNVAGPTVEEVNAKLRDRQRAMAPMR